ncbi:MAG: DUF4230 domain-containing protein [Candidatus Shapirobacteria bacterium]
MKKIIAIGITLVVVAVVITLCLKSFKKDDKDNNLLDLLPESQKVETTIDTPLIIEEIRQLGRLETVEINLQQIFKGERNQDFLWGIAGEKIVFDAYASVVAGVDLSQITSEDIVIEGKNIKINLPSSEIFYVVMDESFSFVVSRQIGLLGSADPDLESQIRQEAQNYFKSQAQQMDILITAQTNAEAVIQDFLQKLGFEQVEFIADVEINIS